MTGDRLFRIAPPGLIMMQGMDPARAGFARELRQHVIALAPPQDQARSLVPQRRVQPRQAVVQPPALCAAHGPFARRLIVQHIDRDDRPFGGGGRQSGLVGKAKILAEPEQDGIGHPRPMPPAPARFQASLGAYCVMVLSQIGIRTDSSHGRRTTAPLSWRSVGSARWRCRGEHRLDIEMGTYGFGAQGTGTGVSPLRRHHARQHGRQGLRRPAHR